MKENAVFSKFGVRAPANKTWFTPREVGEMIGRSPQYVRQRIESGELGSHDHAPPVCRGGRSYRVHRDNVIWFLINTAQYNPDVFLDELRDIVERRGALR